jgi:hypothetical protein
MHVAMKHTQQANRQGHLTDKKVSDEHYKQEFHTGNAGNGHAPGRAIISVFL